MLTNPVTHLKLKTRPCGPQKFHPSRKGRPGKVRSWAIHVEVVVLGIEEKKRSSGRTQTEQTECPSS
jgi:hypothetical protein